MAAHLQALLRAKLRCRLAVHAHAHLTPRSRPTSPPHHHANVFMHSPLAVPARGLAARASRKKKDAATVRPLSTPDARAAGDGKVEDATAAKKKEARIVTTTKKGAAVLDPHIPDDMNKSWHVLQAGYDVLKRISNAISRADRIQLEQLTGELYTMIPHDIGFKKMREFIIDTPEKLKSKLEMVEALGEIEIATKLLEDDLTDQDDPLYARYKQPCCDFTPLEVDSQEYSMIKTYLTNTHGKNHSGYNVDIVQIFKVTRQGETERFQKFIGMGNRMLLWLGSRLTNWTGIFSKGLRIAPPEAPNNGYMFGKGVYFADMFSKSANYCCFSEASNKSGVLLLCEVALGDMNELTHGDVCANNLPKGKLSTKGLGKTAPDMAKSKIIDDDVVVVPLGKPKKASPGEKGVLNYNEYIVYNVDQIRIRYICPPCFLQHQEMTDGLVRRRSNAEILACGTQNSIENFGKHSSNLMCKEIEFIQYVKNVGLNPVFLP